MKNFPVIIVGSGICGLFSALRLVERKISVCILEASSSPGGRVCTTYQADTPIETGLDWIPTLPNDHRLTEYFHLLSPQKDDLIYTEICSDDMIFFKKDYHPLEDQLLDQVIFNIVSDIEDIHQETDLFDECLTLSEALGYVSSYASKEENLKRSILYTLQSPYSSGKIEKHLGSSEPNIELGRNISKRGLSHIIRQIISHIRKLAKDNNTLFEIKYNQAVTKITTVSADHVNVVTNEHAYQCKRLLCTLSGDMIEAQTIQFNPQLPKQVSKRIHQAKSATIEKLLIYYNQPITTDKKYILIETDNPDKPDFYINYQSIYPQRPQCLAKVITHDQSINTQNINIINCLDSLERCLDIPKSKCDREKTTIIRAKNDRWLQSTFNYIDEAPGKRTNNAVGHPPLFFSNETFASEFAGSVLAAVDAGIHVANRISKSFHGGDNKKLA